MSITTRHRVVLFLALTYALSSIFYIRIASTGKLKMFPVFGLMWCPGAAALIVRLFSQRNLHGGGWKWGATKWQVLSYLLPPHCVWCFMASCGLPGSAASRLPGWAPGKEVGLQIPLPATIVLLATVGFLQAAIFALGEEIDWRGFLVPELSQVSSFTMTALISGAAWSVYHYPLMLFANYNSGAPKRSALLAFTWMVVTSSFVYAWRRLKSGSVWTAITLHASHNLFVQEILIR